MYQPPDGATAPSLLQMCSDLSSLRALRSTYRASCTFPVPAPLPPLTAMAALTVLHTDGLGFVVTDIDASRLPAGLRSLQLLGWRLAARIPAWTCHRSRTRPRRWCRTGWHAASQR